MKCLIIIFFLTALVFLNFNEFKNYKNMTNSNLFNLISIDVLSFSLFVFKIVHQQYYISLVNELSLIILLYIYNQEKYSLLKTILLIINLINLFFIFFKFI